MMKTKAFLSGATLLLSVLIAIEARSDNKTLFIYHSEGVEPILFSEIESIRLSKVDLDEEETPDFCVQEFCTQDSVYRYRIADIEKVSFQSPPTIADEGAIDLAGPIGSFIMGVEYGETPTLTFKETIPSEMLPKVGDKLYQLEPGGILEYGFAGIVDKVEGTVIEWSACLPEDIFESLAYCHDTESEMPSSVKGQRAPEDQIPWYAAKCKIPHETVHIMTDDLKDISVGKAQSYVDAEIKIQPIINCRTGIYVIPPSDPSKKPTHLRKMYSAVKMNVAATAEGRCILEKEESWKSGEAITVKTAAIGLGQKVTAKFSGSIKASGKMGVDYTYSASYNSSAVSTVLAEAPDLATTSTAAHQHVLDVPKHTLDASLSGKLSLSGILSLTVTGVTDSLKSITQSYTYGSALSGEAFYKKSELADAHTDNSLYVRLTNGGVKASPVENISSVVKYSQQTLKRTAEIKKTAATAYYAVPKFDNVVYANGVLKYDIKGTPMKSVLSSLGTAVKDADNEFTFAQTDKKWPGITLFEASPKFSTEKGDIVYPTATLDGEVILGAPQYPQVNSVLTPIITYTTSKGVRLVSGTPYFKTERADGVSIIMGTPPGWVTGKKKTPIL